MKKILIVFILLCLNISTVAFAIDVDKVWQGRRNDDSVEQTLWRVQDYVQSQECDDITNLSCYEMTGKEKYLAQSLMFDSFGDDGVWFHFFAPRGVKNKGAVTLINQDNFAQSPRFFCRGRLSRGGARRITTPVSEQKSIDSSVNFSWAMMMMQTGAEIFSKNLFVYSIEHGQDNIRVISAIAKSGMPSHKLYVNEKNAIERIDFVDAQGKVKWIVKNMEISYSDNHWQEIKTFVIDITRQKASLMQRDDSLSFAKWPRTYNKKSLPCGR